MKSLYIKEKDEVISQEVAAMGDENYVAWSDRLRLEGKEEGLEQGLEQGIQALVIDNLEDKKSEEEIISRLMRHFKLDEKNAKMYFDKYSKICC